MMKTISTHSKLLPKQAKPAPDKGQRVLSSQLLILVGFKNVGKTVIGSLLAQKLGRAFVDLDRKIVVWNEALTGEKMTCRQIMKTHGEKHFRTLEHQVLKQILAIGTPFVLAVGGGTPLMEANRELMAPHLIIHISAPKSIVFERIMINGKPAFFPENQEPFISFQQLWKEREPIFTQMADITVQNAGSIDQAVRDIEIELAKPSTVA